MNYRDLAEYAKTHTGLDQPEWDELLMELDRFVETH